MFAHCLWVSATLLLGATSGLSFSGSRSAAAQEPPQEPVLALAPAAGSAGTVVAAKGSGFQGDCAVRIYFDRDNGPLLSSANVDRSGGFAIQFAVPESAAAGPHQLLARALRPGTDGCVEPSRNQAAAPFDVTAAAPIPVLVIGTVQARPGGSVHIEGRSFCPDPGCSSVTVLIDGQVVAGDVAVSAAGAFSTEARVPAIKTAGRVVVAAVQTLTDQTEIQAFGELEVTTRPNVRPRPVQ